MTTAGVYTCTVANNKPSNNSASITAGIYSYSVAISIGILCLDGSFDKWKNNFYEMKGDVGMSLHEKGRNKKMTTPRHKVTHNSIPTSLFCFNMLFVCLFVCYECIRQSKQHNIFTSNCLRNMLCCGLRRNKDVGMGAGPLKGATPRRGVWRRSRPLLLEVCLCIGRIHLSLQVLRCSV